MTPAAVTYCERVRCGPPELEAELPPRQPAASRASAALERAAGRMRCGGVGGLRRRLAGQVLLGQQRVSPRPLDHLQQAGHARDLLHLLLDEPVHELLAGVVTQLARERGKPADLVADAALLFERQRDRLDGV